MLVKNRGDETPRQPVFSLVVHITFVIKIKTILFNVVSLYELLLRHNLRYSLSDLQIILGLPWL